MTFIEVLLLGAALAMDACAMGMTNGMTDSKMPLKRVLLIAAFFGFFQFLMPLIGYFITSLLAGAFMQQFEKISAWVSFALLAFLGGKMLADAVKEYRCKKSCTTDVCDCCQEKKLTIFELFLQAIATSIDALAVGVTLQMAAISPQGLALGAWGSTLLIGGTTFILAVGAVFIGKKLGDKLADKATFLGGAVLLAIGLKILLSALL